MHVPLSRVGGAIAAALADLVRLKPTRLTPSVLTAEHGRTKFRRNHGPGKRRAGFATQADLDRYTRRVERWHKSHKGEPPAHLRG